MEQYDSGEDGFIVKGEAVQNQTPFKMKFIKKKEDLNATIISMYEQPSSAFNKLHTFTAERFSYCMIQEKMNNTQESKVVLFHGKALYICKSKKCIPNRHDEILLFAETAWNALRVASNGAYLCDGITRIDIFSDNHGNLVVNEFENLDANFGSTPENEAMINQYLTHYYIRKLTECIQHVKEKE